MKNNNPRQYNPEEGYFLPDHWIVPKEGLFHILHKAYIERVVRFVVESKARNVLEPGCGDGWNCAQLIKAGLKVTGIDLNKNAIYYAKHLVPAASFEVCDIRDLNKELPLQGTFDAAVLIEVLEHILPADCVSLLRGIRDCIKIGGVLIITTPSVNRPNTNFQHYRHFSENALRSLVEECGGLKIKLIEGYGDIDFESRHYKIARWVDNRYYVIKPVIRWLENRYNTRCTATSLKCCCGLIVMMERIN